MATGGVSDNDAGLASGLFNTAQQVGGSLGLAILASLAATQTGNVLHGLGAAAATPTAQLAARVSGYHVAFAAAAAMLGAGALILVLALRHRHVRALETDLVPAPVPA